MANSHFDEFAESLVRLVRDTAIRNCRLNLRPGAKYPEAERWKTLLNTDDSREAVANTIIHDCVDQTIFCLLNAIDGGWNLSLTGSDGEQTDLSCGGYGEMAGWYLGEDEDSWRVRFSKEKINKYLDGLEL